jgi:hypothetical protein
MKAYDLWGATSTTGNNTRDFSIRDLLSIASGRNLSLSVAASQRRQVSGFNNLQRFAEFMLGGLDAWPMCWLFLVKQHPWLQIIDYPAKDAREKDFSEWVDRKEREYFGMVTIRKYTPVEIARISAELNLGDDENTPVVWSHYTDGSYPPLRNAGADQAELRRNEPPCP